MGSGFLFSRTCRATLAPSLLRRTFVFLLSAARAAFLSAAAGFVDRRPGAPFRLFLFYTAFFVALLDVLRFALLFTRIFGFFAFWHTDLFAAREWCVRIDASYR